jgi:hypothetical protein
MFKVQVTSFGKTTTFEFATHPEASRFTREALKKRSIQVKLVTPEVRNDRGHLGGYGGVMQLRPNHNFAR